MFIISLAGSGLWFLLIFPPVGLIYEDNYKLYCKAMEGKLPYLKTQLFLGCEAWVSSAFYAVTLKSC